VLQQISLDENLAFLVRENLNVPKAYFLKCVIKTGGGNISPPPSSFHCYIYLADEIFLHQIWRTGLLSGTGNFQNLNMYRVNHKE